jgi:mono/diheme cytochrome c family protein
MNIRFLWTLFFVLLLAGVSRADLDLTPVGSGYYVDSYGDYYTRQKVYSDYYYYYGQYVPRYYQWKYYPASKPVTTLTPKSTDAEFVQLLRSREAIAGKIALNEQEKNAFVERLKAIGVTPPLPAVPAVLPAFNGGSGYGAISGSTLYGYAPVQQSVFQFSQQADVYGAYSPEITQQGGMALAKEVGRLFGQVTTDVNGLSERDAQRAERLQTLRFDHEFRLKAQQIEADGAKARLEALRPPNRITTTINRIEPAVMPRADGSVPPALPPVPQPGAAGDGPFTPRYVAVVKAQCITCHGKDAPKGKFDMTSALLTPDQKAKVLARIMLPITHKDHMPQLPDGKPGRQLTAQEIHDVLD